MFNHQHASDKYVIRMLYLASTPTQSLPPQYISNILPQSLFEVFEIKGEDKAFFSSSTKPPFVR